MLSALRVLVLFASLLFVVPAFAAPDEAELGKAEGYPLCPGAVRPENRCLVALVSRFDELFPARTIPRGGETHVLKRAPAEPAIEYRHQGQRGGVDDYLARNRTTGLLILKGDTILVERYQYDRAPEHRMASYSMAKTIVAMLVGVALSEGKDTVAGRSVRAVRGRAQGHPVRRDAAALLVDHVLGGPVQRSL